MPRLIELLSVVEPLETRYWQHAPKTVQNFVGLCRKGYYDNCTANSAYPAQAANLSTVYVVTRQEEDARAMQLLTLH